MVMKYIEYILADKIGPHTERKKKKKLNLSISYNSVSQPVLSTGILKSMLIICGTPKITIMKKYMKRMGIIFNRNMPLKPKNKSLL